MSLKASHTLSVAEASWPEDQNFLQALQLSWVDQYAEYLGQATAVSMIDRLLANGELYPRDEQPLVIARIGSEPVGIASLRHLQGISLISMLEVLELYRQQGIGKALIAALGERSEKLLVHVSIHRPQVKTFYQGLGFKLLDRSVVEHYGHKLEFDVLAKGS